MVSRDAVIETEPVDEQAPDRGRRIIAVVGIDRYRYHQRLRNAVSDARGVQRLFTQTLGFVDPVPHLYDEDATRDAIKVMIDEQLRSELRGDDELVLFFSGHGLTREDEIGQKRQVTGFLVPVDARHDHWNDFIKVSDWLDSVNTLPARHILVIIDACHSGVALGSAIEVFRGGRVRYRDELSRRVSRKAIASAMHDQLAQDSGPIEGHSLFTGMLIDGLETGRADLDGNQMLTGSELSLYVQQRVGQASEHLQTPDFGTFGADARGELCIPLKIRGEHRPGELGEPMRDEGPQPARWTRWRLPIAAALLAGAIGAAAWFMSDGPEDPEGGDPSRTDSGASVSSDGAVLVQSTSSTGGMDSGVDALASSCPSDMVLVPAAEFMAGYASAALADAAYERCREQFPGFSEDDPRRSCKRRFFAGARSSGRLEPVEAFCMDRTEVTVGEFAPWLDEQRASLKVQPTDDGSAPRFIVPIADPERPWVGLWISSKADDPSVPKLVMLEIDARGRWRPAPGMAQRPVFLVSWEAADAWCRTRGERLPTELQWEYAARGPDRRAYVWGDAAPECADVALARYRGACDGLGMFVDVGRSPVDTAWSSVMDLGGNVSEWVADLHEDPEQCSREFGVERPTCHVYKGGNWQDGRVFSQPALRYLDMYWYGGINGRIGFRCVRDPR